MSHFAAVPRPASMDYFEPLRKQRNILLTTYRRDGTPVGTPVHVVTRGDVAFVRTYEPSGKMKRIRRDPVVEVAPSTIRGRPTGPALPAKARILSGEEAAEAARLLAGKYRILHGHLIPWYHRRTGRTTVQLELTSR
jgi:PPOX class probable F420-dependent enzyme